MTLVMSEYRIVSAGPDAAVVSKYGDAARDTGDEPVETFFWSAADAQLFATERLGLLSRDAARMDMTVSTVESALDIALAGQSATANVIDRERDISRPMIITKAVISFGRDKSQIGVWG